MGEHARKGAEPFSFNREVLVPGLKAPLPLAGNSRPQLADAFRKALQLAGTPPELVEPAAVTGGGIIHAFQELVLGANRLISEPREALPGAVRLITWACRDLRGAGEAAYVLKQASEAAGPAVEGGPEEDLGRQKDLMGPMERRFEELGLPVSMDPVRFAVLQVHLDEVYDQACRQLQGFYRLVEGEEASGRLKVFAPRLASTVTREVIPDHILASGAERERTGLLDLLPELERDLAD